MFVLLGILALASAKPQGIDYAEGSDDGLMKGEQELQDCINNLNQRCVYPKQEPALDSPLYPNAESYSSYVDNGRVARSVCQPNLSGLNFICYPVGSSTPAISYPAQSQAISGSTQNQAISYPAQNQAISFPAQSQAISFPPQNQAISFPAQSQANSAPKYVCYPISQQAMFPTQSTGQTSNLAGYPFLTPSTTQNVFPMTQQTISPNTQQTSTQPISGSMNTFLNQVFDSIPSLSDVKCTVIPGSSFNLGPSCQVTPLYTITMINDNANVC